MIRTSFSDKKAAAVAVSKLWNTHTRTLTRCHVGAYSGRLDACTSEKRHMWRGGFTDRAVNPFVPSRDGLIASAETFNNGYPRQARVIPSRSFTSSSSSKSTSSASSPVESKNATPNNDKNDNSEDPDAYSPHRHTGILLHPDSISKLILPGNFVKKISQRRGRGTAKKRYTELVYGYFWMLKDLRMSNEKPILSNLQLIPEHIAKPFPTLSHLRKLVDGESVTVPEYFLRKNRSRDAAAQCTIVCVSFRDYGYQVLKSWVNNNDDDDENEKKSSSIFTQASSTFPPSFDRRVEFFRLNISEGWLSKWILRRVILGLTKRNTQPSEQDKTLMYFGGGNDLDAFRDALRMHNLMTGYIFLLDGLGRVRFAGSGPASPEEVKRLQVFTAELIHQQPPPSQQQQQQQQRKEKQQRNRL